MSDFIGPIECVELAAEVAGIVLDTAQITDFANALVDIGADFNIREDD